MQSLTIPTNPCNPYKSLTIPTYSCKSLQLHFARDYKGFYNKSLVIPCNPSKKKILGIFTKFQGITRDYKGFVLKSLVIPRKKKILGMFKGIWRDYKGKIFFRGIARYFPQVKKLKILQWKATWILCKKRFMPYLAWGMKYFDSILIPFRFHFDSLLTFIEILKETM